MALHPRLVDASAFEDLKSLFHAFLDSQPGAKYSQRLHDMHVRMNGRQSFRLIIDLHDFQLFDANVTEAFIRCPLQFLAPWTNALHDWIRGLEHTQGRQRTGMLLLDQMSSSSEILTARLHLGFVGGFDRLLTTPRSLRASHIGRLVNVEGIVVRCLHTHPKVVRDVDRCEQSQKHAERIHRDSSDLDIWMDPYSRRSAYEGYSSRNFPRLPTVSADPKGPTLSSHWVDAGTDVAIYKDHQCITLQETPEKTPHGQLPRSVSILLDNDLADTLKPGDRVRCTGVYRALIHSAGSVSGVLACHVIATAMTKCRTAQTKQQVDTGVLTQLRDSVFPRLETNALAKNRECELRKLASILAPSIHGYDALKCALVLQLVGGSEKVLSSGGRLRGDINILIVGDPSTAKSQLLRAALRAAPLGVSATGRGSSGVGLTASISRDPDSGERTFEAGAVVLADRGIVCVDEFDKMSTSDRVAIHEVMEQQTVTIAKAGLLASLNARCAILAAANPTYGQYDPSLLPRDNIGLPDSLLSRFDLLYLVLDNTCMESDKEKSEFVLRLHMNASCREVARSTTSEIETFRSSLSRDVVGTATNASMLLRKLINYVRYCPEPELSDDARDRIASNYADLRGKADSRTLPVTARCLESLIRLATASAKVQLRDRVLPSDCATGYNLLSYCLFGEIERDWYPSDRGATPCHKASTSCDEPNITSSKGITSMGLPLDDSEFHDFTSDVMAALKDTTNSDCVHMDDLLARVKSIVVTSEVPCFQDLENVVKSLERQNCVMYDAASGLVHLL